VRDEIALIDAALAAKVEFLDTRDVAAVLLDGARSHAGSIHELTGPGMPPLRVDVLSVSTTCSATTSTRRRPCR
jgi:hypothetical protein